MSNIKYSIEQTDGNMVVRSTVKSFNLDHVTDKDITSYYRQLSSQALFDTGLLPLNGTGVLAIRSAGRHTQIAFQHAPTLAYINWGRHEGDPTAKAYLLAQPYRIWIADLLDGNLYGARMFYSPYPISHSDQVLYHVNLPNTNCKGYKGNGVGWQCLYHNEDWTNLSFNEKIDKLIQRCSGIEAYNDGNMSETDGPRFYQQYNKPEYLWNPTLWQEKSQSEGLNWTLDESLWIPILVKDMDNQDKHYDDGQPLTFAMALLGKYNSYYGDEYHPKLVNAFARPDIDIPVQQVYQIFTQSYNSAKTNPERFDQFNTASLNKIKISQTVLKPQLFDQPEHDDDDDDDQTIYCHNCEDEHNVNDESFTDPLGNWWCLSCFEEFWVYCENVDNYLHVDNKSLKYIEAEQIYIDSAFALVESCPNCQSEHWVEKNTNQKFPFFEHYVEDQNLHIKFCTSCFSEISNQYFGISENSAYQHIVSCSECHSSIFINLPNFSSGASVLEAGHSWFKEFDNHLITKHYCQSCAVKVHYCPSGHWTQEEFISLVPWITTTSIQEETVYLKIKELCKTCYNSNYSPDDPNSIPFAKESLQKRALFAVQKEIANDMHSLAFELFNFDGSLYSNKEPF